MNPIKHSPRGMRAAFAAVSLSLLVSSAAQAQIPTSFPAGTLLPTKGDVNRDARVNVSDAQLTLKTVIGMEALAPDQEYAADTVVDGELDVQDAVHILKQAVGILPVNLPVKPFEAVPNGNLNGLQVLPADNEWNRPINADPVDPNSTTIINAIGASLNLHPDFGADYNGGPFGIPYVVISGDVPKVPVNFYYSDESDPGPYPIPENAPIEGGPTSSGDRHVIVVDKDRGMLYETFNSFPNAGSWTADSGAIFDLNSNDLRPLYWTSADAAGLPIFPGLVRYEEVAEQKEIRHALRFTVARTRRAFVHPARHWASSRTETNLPPMGMRVRLKASFDLSKYPPSAQVILKALKTYGMILADNGSNWFLSGAPDERWNDNEIGTLKRVKGSDFEVVKMGPITTK